ncbi:hypothetical protein ZHAS_00015670 [Anopheles sinensis]|uniref:Uncharacterized protein n=1 Tax=Anopheles sinensis TaxID=74873 RepID=A0A084WBM8_ANOSI|nr:hypothetical protein ZHAS_00015670 [Anopheles sinensis]
MFHRALLQAFVNFVLVTIHRRKIGQTRAGTLACSLASGVKKGEGEETTRTIRRKQPYGGPGRVSICVTSLRFGLFCHLFTPSIPSRLADLANAEPF